MSHFHPCDSRCQFQADVVSRAERDALQARLDAAYERLGIEEFGGSYAHNLESLIDYAVKQYRLVCDSEAKAADEVRRLTGQVDRVTKLHDEVSARYGDVVAKLAARGVSR